MSGSLALHGGAEFLPGDEPFLRHLLQLAITAARARAGAAPTTTVRIEVLTTAVARHRPDVSFAVASAALERLAAEVPGTLARVRHAKVIDAGSAEDSTIAGRLRDADLIYLVGGDPDAVIEILAGTLAWRSVEAARARGAVVAGASAGAMALGERTWTPDGFVAGFGWAGRIVVVPHATAEQIASGRPTIDALPHGPQLAILGLPEKAGVTGGPGAWTVVGDAGAWWWPPGAEAPRHERAGSVIRN